MVFFTGDIIDYRFEKNLGEKLDKNLDEEFESSFNGVRKVSLTFHF